MTNVCNVSYKHTRPPYFPDGRYKSGVDKGKYGKGGRGTEYVWNVCKKNRSGPLAHCAAQPAG